MKFILALALLLACPVSTADITIADPPPHSLAWLRIEGCPQ
jgi:hypothetical protein